MTSTSKKLINLHFLKVVSFPFVLSYLLVEGFSLLQTSVSGPEDNGCSLVTYLGQRTSIFFKLNVCRCCRFRSYSSIYIIFFVFFCQVLKLKFVTGKIFWKKSNQNFVILIRSSGLASFCCCFC